MSRTQARALVLVNWLGVFYERYQLDPHVTALEGPNAAGKTTVMIAAYVVLLPDMTRLRFTNIGESGTTGGDKGIYGRLGRPGRPSYTALDLAMPDGTRLVAGVHLERRSEPTVELTPFIITGLGGGLSLQEILLDRGDLQVDSVPELERMRELAARKGAHVKTYSSAKEYFADLFDYGVLPLRLAGDEERAKFNEMLRTSMIGGISRSVSGGMREFLLKEETGLGDTLKRMRANLDACRKTRQQVQSSTQLEAEIRGVLEAGQKMFAAAMQAARERERETRERLDEARRLAALARDECDARFKTLESLRQKRTAAVTALHDSREELNRQTAIRDRLEAALKAVRRLQKLTVQRQERERYEKDARAVLSEAETSQSKARTRRDESQKLLQQASLGLADFQHGLDLLHRRAADYRQARNAQLEIRTALPGESCDAEDVADLRARCEARSRSLAGDIDSIERQLEQADCRRQEFDRVSRALHRILSTEVSAREAHGRGREALARLREQEQRVEALPGLRQQLHQASISAKRQRAIRQAVEKLAREEGALASAAAVHSASRAAEHEHDEVKGRQKQAHSEIRELRQLVQRSKLDAKELEHLYLLWREVQGRFDSLAARWNHPLKSRADLEALRRALLARRDAVREEAAVLQSERDEIQRQMDRAHETQGDFAEELLDARDLVEGELFASRFEEVGVEEAPLVQAKLGPLADAILVDDPFAAAAALALSKRRPDTVWLLGGEANLGAQGDPLEGEVLEDSVLVRSSRGWRLTRFPQRPTLGRKAREAWLAELSSRRTDIDSRLQVLHSEEATLADGLRETSDRAGEVELRLRADPADELDRALRRVEEQTKSLARLELEEEELTRIAATALARAAALRELLPEAHLLDLEDQEAVEATLQSRVSRALVDKEELERVRADRAVLSHDLEVLQRLPLSHSELEELRLRKARFEEERSALPLRALAVLEPLREALAWSDAEANLASEQALRPALEEQLAKAKDDDARAASELVLAESNYSEALKEHARTEGQLASAVDAEKSAQVELADLNVENPTPERLEAAKQQVDRQSEQVSGLDQRERELGEEIARTEPALADAWKRARESEERVDAETKQWAPALETWQRLERAARERNLLVQAMSATFAEEVAGSVQLRSQAKQEARLLLERLGKSSDGSTTVPEVEQCLAGEEQASADAYLNAWLAVRDWLQRRIPPQIAETGVPLEALQRLHEHLLRLTARLEQQESDLRGRSENVARNVETSLRKAGKRVHALNSRLESVRFGSIRGIKILVRRVERMEKVLRALRDSQGQQLLFHSELPIEEAMEAIFEQYAGGKMGGQRLLDYREYIELELQVKRQAGVDWETANATRLSTGEAIGVGAVVMMVVLTAWEQDANLLRGKRSHGTLRFLFLDEANRLSQDNLAVLFELCRNLELQLLLAAPEVAEAEGNTTYRLVRQVDADGLEEVLVTGRRLKRETAT